MKKIINYKKSIVLVCALFLSVSCQDFLQDELLSDTSVDFVLNTPEGLESGVVALYNLERNIYEKGQNEWMISLILQNRTDLVIPRAGAGSLIGRYIWGEEVADFGTSARVGVIWRHFYRIVDRANAIIKAAEEIQDIDEDRRNQILGEAKCFRARAYFSLYRMFNNIFIKTEPTTPDNAFDRPQDKSSEAEIFALINSDLDFAIANLDMTTPQFGRYTQAAARHMRAKTALWQQDWATAAAQAEAVINDGNYSLVPNTKDVFDGDLNNSETLHAIVYSDGEIGGGNRNLIHFNLVARYDKVPGAKYAIENGNRSLGFLTLNDYLRNLLKEDPNDTRDDGTYYISYYTYNDADNLPAGVSLGDTIRIYDQFSSDSGERNKYYERLNPGCLKFLDEAAEPSSATEISNIMIYRLAETYLIAAEAEMELGNTGIGLQYLNAVRNRAGAADATALDLDAILDERARELAFEGQRFYTLKRRGVFVSYVQDHGGNDNFRSEIRDRVEPKHVNWPIDQNEIDLLGPNYPQNDGY
jgi:hypothetical protein